jgi:hypothetical protein
MFSDVQYFLLIRVLLGSRARGVLAGIGEPLIGFMPVRHGIP